MQTVGVDLAAEPKNTALAAIEWSEGRAQVVDVQVGVDDNRILQAAETAAKIGIDCPLGWPDRFVRFLRGFHEGTLTEIPAEAGQDWRRSLAYRVTDEQVRSVLTEFKVIPLSVATDRIGLTAMRAARIQALLKAEGHDVDRTGTGLIVEVYPAGGLACWQMKHNRYKGRQGGENLQALVRHLQELAPWLEFNGHTEICQTSDHALDAVIAALLARAAALGQTTPPAPEQLDIAAKEGWIALPTCEIDALVHRA